MLVCQALRQHVPDAAIVRAVFSTGRTSDIEKKASGYRYVQRKASQPMLTKSKTPYTLGRCFATIAIIIEAGGEIILIWPAKNTCCPWRRHTVLLVYRCSRLAMTIPFPFQNPFAPGFFVQDHPGYKTPRGSSELQRQRYTVCTPIHGATDGVPPLGIMFKASPESRLANVADASVSGSLSQALPHEILMASGSQDDEQMILAVRAYHESLYARQHLMWAKFLLQRGWNWGYRTPNWWLQCNEREAQREWIYD